jgi:general stress protein YciG
MLEHTESSGSRERGFAAMDRNKQKEIASMGGKAAHAKGTAHEFTSEEAARAGSKGGRAAHEKGTAHEFSRQEATEAGRKGGQASGKRNRAELIRAKLAQTECDSTD